MFNVFTKARRLAAVPLLVVLAFSAAPQMGMALAQSADNGVTTITGNVYTSNPFVQDSATEPYIMLVDMTAFIKRDHELPLPANQVIAHIEGDITQKDAAKYTINLPINAPATLNDVSNGKGDTKGLAVLALDFDNNSFGDPFQSTTEFRGWPGALDSLLFDPGTYEVTGGKLAIWAPDDKQMFPTGFGADGKLFTADDPVGAVGKGWTVVDLDKKPFDLIRTDTADVPILEGLGANNDLSALSYTDAFDALVKDLKVRYTFSDYKKIDWASIVADIRPLVVKAEQAKDLTAFNIAMLQFAARFHDGHLSAQAPQDYVQQQISGGLGMVLGQADDGTVIARIVLDSLPAAAAGIKAGATILEWNGKPIEDALAGTELLFTTQSSPHGIRQQQLRYIMRGPVGTKFTIKFQNSGDSAATTVDMTSVKDAKSFSLSSLNAGKTVTDTPVEMSILPSGIGYVKINTFEGDSVLISHSWENALKTLDQAGVPALIVDARQNGGGSGLLSQYFAGSFYTTGFVEDKTLEADKNGKFVEVGADHVDPAPVQWTKPVAVLVGPACFSACEIFAGAMAHNPDNLIVGRYPTAGVEAGVEPWTLPGGIYFQAPVQRLVDTAGNIFLEGVGVKPNVKVPVTVQSLLSTDDPDIPAAEKALQAKIPPQ